MIGRTQLSNSADQRINRFRRGKLGNAMTKIENVAGSMAKVSQHCTHLRADCFSA
jgi:hypothetical protein